MSFFSSLFGGGRLSGAQARERVAAGSSLLDVRSPGEFSGGSLPGATNLPVQELAAGISSLDRSTHYVVFCASGMRSAAAVKQLRAAGIDADDLGPMNAW